MPDIIDVDDRRAPIADATMLADLRQRERASQAHDLLARWHCATGYHALLVDALVERFTLRSPDAFVRAADLGLGDDVTVLRMRMNLPRLEKQIYVPAYGTIDVCKYSEPVEVASTTHWPGGTVNAPGAELGVFVRLVDDVRAVLRVLIFEPTAYAASAR